MSRKQMFIVYCLLFIAVSALPFDAAAQQKGVVPCGTAANPTPCEPCHIFVLIQNILNFIWGLPPYTPGLVLPIAILMLAIGGFMMLVPGVGGEKSVAMYQKGKKVLTNTMIGLVIIFLAWLAVDTIIKALGGKMAANTNVVTVTGFGPWNKIKCETK